MPGDEASIDLTVHNSGDIVEGYRLEPVGPLAAWTELRPDRLSLYPGTSGTVTLVVRPPRSAEVRAGEVPVGVRVLPSERPDTAVVPEATVVVAPFVELDAALVPQVRKRRRRAKYTVELDGLGNVPLVVSVAGTEAGEQLRFRTRPDRHTLGPGDATAVELVVRSRKLRWFGRPVHHPFQVVVDAESALVDDALGLQVPSATEPPPSRTLDGTFTQLPVFPRWLLALLAALLALLLAWFALLRPAVRSAAREAVDAKVRETPGVPGLQPPAPGGGGAAPGGGAASKPSQAAPPQDGGQGGDSGPGQTGTGRGTQFATTVQTRGRPGGTTSESFIVPDGKLFRVTDMIVSNFQGDEGQITISFGPGKITTIALETFRNQDYHWVTPIEVPARAAIKVDVACNRPGVFPNGQQATSCVELLNVNGSMFDVPR